MLVTMLYTILSFANLIVEKPNSTIWRVHCSAFEVSFLCILECPHQHTPCTHDIRNQYKYSTIAELTDEMATGAVTPP
jgi:hypothetical protein